MAEPGGRDLWASFPHDPRDPAVASLRASDADRDLVQQVLTDAFADGRLDREEYDERAATTLSARTLGELPPIVADLVPERPLLPATTSGRAPLVAASSADLQQRALEKWRRERQEAIGAFLFPTVICWVIWSATMFGGFPWPLIVTAATLLNLLRVFLSRGEIVTSELRRLEKKQAKELEARARKNPPDPAP